MDGVNYDLIGNVRGSKEFTIRDEGETVVSTDIDELKEVWQATLRNI